MTRARSRGRPRDAAADAAILRAGIELFIERGIDGASIEQIAKRASVGKLTVYRRWSTKEELIAAAIETLFANEVSWPPPEVIDTASPYELVEAALSNAAQTAAAPEFRALVARVLGCAVSHPSLMATYWKHFIVPRRTLAARLLARARELETVSADADLDVAIDMMVGAIMWRVLQPDPPDVVEMHRYLTAVYRQAGLLP
ncbi:TetR/AcrR family transcriptional regulator [Mycobacterium haemophilum]|uniref:TetR family transcriptional regulator n=1 Tax=Mycobacterium haemophilum TaxID=29311 RepID=A0A0I9ULQ2_9MYCO|nr:TetR/AcrR family transcriptional regulator [Mycobacterium haemophilum]KLO32677.1 TetR family transcriptional regulator [Mycobacterium haemophilum]KLO36938.1 TetR family transcriptional regulator [Mycobacterium haemophilum]KLO42958.1 TetR family transcriptional regulator [Mycobacterium haemophilum]KLO55868.1 TetR family transcriptional regulator [Mycobacterium haemophilum]